MTGNLTKRGVTRRRGIVATISIVAATLAPTALVGAQSATCDGQTATDGVTSTVDHSSGVTRISGTSGADVIIGTAGRDVIRGFNGNDVICGLGGNDIIYGGKGADHIEGGDGNDTITGNRGGDVLNGNKGNDTLNGNRGKDRLNGNRGHDILNGGGGDDRLTGANGRDTIRGGDFDDLIDGGPDADLITGNAGHDTCINQERNDSINGCESDTAAPNVGCSQAELSAYYSAQVDLAIGSPNLAHAEQRLLTLINETRGFCDLDPLSIDSRAEGPAQAHSQDMLNDKNAGVPNYFRHSTRWRPLIGTSDISTAGENIALVSPSVDPTRIHRNLVDSGDHLCNILSPNYDGIGLGFTYVGTHSDGGFGLIVTEIFTGDSNYENTTGSLIVLDDLADPNSERINCWS